MQAIINKTLSVLISLVMVLMMIPETEFIANAAYENTHTNTGNQREDIVAVAETQKGYHEGANDDTKYNRWNGVINGYPLGGYGYPWCQCFVSWCANQAGIPTDIIPKTAGTYTGSDFFKNRGIWQNSAGYGGTYVPHRGDIIYFSDSHNVNAPSHVGIVTGCSNGYVYTIEGNCSDAVSTRGLSLTDGYIIGYGVPNYDEPIQKATTLFVTPGYSVSDTFFSWNAVENADHYDLKIWKGEHWVGDAYHVEWGLKDTSCNLNLPSGDYEAYIDTTVGDEFQMSNVVAFIVKDGTILSVNASYSASDTEFSWVQVPNADHYDLKIWKGKCWDGDSYVTKWGLKDTSCNVDLPAGYYEAYVDTTVGETYQMSNVVSFTIVDGTPLTYELGNSSSETVFHWNAVNNAESYDLKIWNGTCWVGDAYHIQWGVKDTSFGIQLPVGYYEAYVDTTINGEYANMSNIVSFEVKNGTKLSVEAGTSKKETVFNWSNIPGAENYDLKIWNGTYWVGDAYHIEWGVNDNTVSLQLPAGYYEAYVDTHIDNNYMSNVVGFTVVEAKEIEGDCNDDGSLNVSDVVLLQKWLLAVPDTHLANWQAADLCKDNKLDVFDLCMMKRLLLSNNK